MDPYKDPTWMLTSGSGGPAQLGETKNGACVWCGNVFYIKSQMVNLQYL